MRIVSLVVVAALLASCRSPAPAAEPAHAPAPSSADGEAAGGRACAPTGLKLVESTPVGTDLEASRLPRTHEVWRELIDGASRTLDIEQFYLASAPGSRLEPVLAAIERAATRGVEVRILADAGFAERYPDTLRRLEKSAALRRFDVARVIGGVQHAKLLVVDRCRSYLGSANFDWRSLEHIHELGVVAVDEAVAASLTALFEMDWGIAAGSPVAAGAADARFPVRLEDGSTVQPLFSPRGWLPVAGTWDLPALLSLIASAEREIRIELLSFEVRSRDGGEFRDLETALLRAGARGVDVKLLVSHWEARDERIEALKQLEQAEGIEVRMATIPEHATGFIPYARVIHAKYLLVDGQRAWIGTSNFGRDYFYESRNAGLLIEGGSIPRQLGEVHARLWDGPYAQPVDVNRSYAEPRIGE